MRRLEIVLLICGTAVWPVVAASQPQLTLIGFLQAGGAAQANYFDAFRSCDSRCRGDRGE
jgi:hypothetical protein